MRLAVCLLTGCLGPQVDDTPLASTALLPAGSTVASLLDDPASAARVADHDGVDGVVPRETAFSGAVVHVWDFGPAPAFAAPLFVLMERDATGALVRTPHNTIVDVVPGDPGYSPFWAPFVLEVTDLYAGELVTSVAAVEEAVERGLVAAPVAQELAVNCPVVGAGVGLEVGVGRVAPPNATFYYRGVTVPYFDFGAMPILAGRVPEGTRYRLRREGQEPLSELVRHVDMTGDGDVNDSNDIYAADPAAVTSTPLLRRTDVVIRSSTASIDTSQDDTVAELQRGDQLFAPTPQSAVISYDVTDELHNIAGQRSMDGL